MASLALQFMREFLLLIVLLLLQHLVLGEKRDLPEGWNVNPANGSLVERTGGNLSSYRPIMNNSNFVLAFVPSPELAASFDLAIVMEQNVYRDVVAIVVHSLYKRVSRLFLSSQLALQFESSEDIFTIAENVMAVELLDTGNLIFYNSTNGIVWQSFDHPADTLLPGRQLKLGARLVTPGHDYVVVLEEQGLAFHLVGFGTYYTWSNKGKDWEGQEPLMELKENKISLYNISLPIEGSDVAFLRLTSKGDIVDFQFNKSSMLWIQGNFSLVLSQTNSFCTLPQWCGDSGYCRLNGECSQDAYFTYLDSPSCAGDLLGPFPFPNTTHFSIFGKQPDFLTTTAVDCWTFCNCSTCSTIIYNATSKGCYILGGRLVGSFFEIESNEMTAVVQRRRPHLDIRFISIIILMLAYGIPPVCCICCSRQLDLLGQQLGRFQQHLKRRLQRLVLQEEAAELERVLGDARGHLPQRFRYSALKTATDSFSQNRKLGAGGFGSVYEAIMVDGQRFAVKELGGGNRQGVKQFVSEIASMASIGHINILRLHGFCIETFHRLLVYEYMSNSSLDHWLFNKTKPILTWEQRQNIALDVARGLAYLHEECREPILHLDVKPQNILLDDRLIAKVADFGMAKLLEDRDASKVETNIRGTPGYIAPEWCLHSIATKKCDVYSYGMVLLELVSGRKNLDFALVGSGSSSTNFNKDDHDDDSSWYFPAWAAKQVQRGKIMRLADERIAGSINEEEIRRMVWLAFWCIQERANLRPAMHEVVLLLEGHQEIKEPPMSYHFPVQGASTLGSTLGEGWVTAAEEVSDGSIPLIMSTGTM